MSGLLGERPSVEQEPGDPSVITLNDSDQESVFDTLSASTARAILAELYRAPAVPSELADAVGASLQTVCYHLDNLEAAGLIEVTEQWYSEKGREMDVYAPTNGPLILMPEDGNETVPAAPGTGQFEVQLDG